MASAATSSSPPAAVEVPEKMPAAQTVPLDAPTPESKPKEHAALNEDQQAKYDWLLGRARAWDNVAAADGKGGPLTESERMWLTRECLLRYLRAEKWNRDKAETRLRATLTWRREFGTEGLTADYISPEQETGKQQILGYDKECRPCHYLNPGKQNTEQSHRQVEHLVYMVERVIDLMPPGQETLALLINFKQSKERKNTAPGIDTGRKVLAILQDHYPERLGRALIINGEQPNHNPPLPSP